MVRNEKVDAERRVVRNFKDAVFRMLFTIPENALMLYNGLNETNYTDVGQLEFNTLENAIYMNIKNDLSFLIAHHMNLYEQQSTFNPNLPLRDLFYVSDLLQVFVKDKSIYSSKMIKIPNPQFVVFYNGRKEMPQRLVLKLSNMFEIATDDPSLELKVTMLNINSGMNTKLKERCPILDEYITYVLMVRKYADTMPIEDAVEMAVNQCVEKGILSDFLRKQRAEVIKMSIYEYDEERELQLIREDERELGREEGVDAYAILTQKLLADERQDDIANAAMDKCYRMKLMKEYGII